MIMTSETTFFRNKISSMLVFGIIGIMISAIDILIQNFSNDYNFIESCKMFSHPLYYVSLRMGIAGLIGCAFGFFAGFLYKR